MALKLRSQDINLFPLPGHRQSGVRRDVVGDELQLGTRENSKGLGLHVTERGLGHNAVVREEFEHLPSLVEVLVAFEAVGSNALLGCLLGFIRISPDMIQQTMKQMIVQTLMLKDVQTQEIDIDAPLFKCFNL
jgi:hypothetical protein